jgi:hypothetical protein
VGQKADEILLYIYSMEDKEELPIRYAKPAKGFKTPMVANSFVDAPAIMVDAMLFSKNNRLEKFDAYKKQQDIFQFKKSKLGYFTGPVMIPNIKILREDDKTKELYYMVFEPETIRKIRDAFMASDRLHHSNIIHAGDTTDKNVVIESWIVEDPEMDKLTALGYKNIEKGTWAMTYKVNDKDLLKRIEDGEIRGFSIEAYLDTYSSIIDKVSDKKEEKFNLFDMKKNTNKTIANIFAKFKDLEKSLFAEVVGTDEEVETQVGEATDLPDGETVVTEEDGDVAIVTVEGGEVADVNEDPTAEEVIAALEGAVEDLKNLLGKKFEEDDKEKEEMKAKISKMEDVLGRIATQEMSEAPVSTKKDFSKMSYFERLAEGAVKNRK